MPFKSEAQRRFMHYNHPELAKEFEAETPKDAKLPERLHKKQPLHRQVKAGMKRAFPNR